MEQARKSRGRDERMLCQGRRLIPFLGTLIRSPVFFSNKKVYTLEKVLKLKKDAVTQIGFLDEAMKVYSPQKPFVDKFIMSVQVLENKPSLAFWTALSHSLEKHAKEASKSV